MHVNIISLNKHVPGSLSTLAGIANKKKPQAKYIVVSNLAGFKVFFKFSIF
jgi:hypothetical protein